MYQVTVPSNNSSQSEIFWEKQLIVGKVQKKDREKYLTVGNNRRKIVYNPKFSGKSIGSRGISEKDLWKLRILGGKQVAVENTRRKIHDTRKFSE